MSRRVVACWSLVSALALCVAIALPVVPAWGQTTGTSGQMSIDSPNDGATVAVGGTLLIGGWAADPAGPGSGVDLVRIYLDTRMEGGTPLGDANYGYPRPDVATASGNPGFATSGFNYRWTANGVSGGAHMLYVYARSVSTGWYYRSISVTVKEQATSTPSRRGGGRRGHPDGYGMMTGPDGYGPGMMPGPGGYGPGMAPGYGPGMAPGPGPVPGPGHDPIPAPPPPPPGGSGRVCILIYPPPPGC